MIYIFRVPFLILIRIYQKTFSPDHGIFSFLFPYGVCKYSPTCSCYGYEAIKKHGVLKGSALTGWRVLRCNPWSEGGKDLVPENCKFKILNPNIEILNKSKIQNPNVQSSTSSVSNFRD